MRRTVQLIASPAQRSHVQSRRESLMTPLFSILLAITVGGGPLATAAVAGPGGGSAKPWLVQVNHRIDLEKYVHRVAGSDGQSASGVMTQERSVTNLTSGLLLDTEGHVLTRLVNLDPANAAPDLTITTNAGKTVPATLVGVDGPTGFIVLEAKGLRGVTPAPVAATATLSDAALVDILSPDFRHASDARRVGFPTAAPVRGRVLQAQASPALIHSGVAFTIQSDDFMPTNDMSVVQGGSGAVLGVAKYVAPGHGYVFPIAYVRDVVVKRVVDAKGSVRSGWLGAEGSSVRDVDAARRPASVDAGVIVNTVVDKSPAARAGLRPNDVITRFDDVPIETTNDLALAVRSLPAGAGVKIVVVRAGAETNLTATLGDRPGGTATRVWLETTAASNPAAVGAPRAVVAPLGDVGLTVIDMSQQLAEGYFKVKGGVLVEEVKAQSAAERAGLRAGDVITRVGTLDVANRAAFTAAVLDGLGRPLVLTVQRDGKPRTVTISLPAAK